MSLTNTNIHDAVAIRDTAKEIFISARAVEEQKFNSWYVSLLKCSKEKVLDKIPFPYEGWTMKTLVPEWYVEQPNPEVCNQQVKEANEKINQINSIIADINAEGLRLLEEYNATFGKGH